MARRTGRAAGCLAALAIVVGLTGCELPPPELVVNTTIDGHDATPGDGVCEVTAGAGDCTVRAAVDEANALGAARLTVPAGAYSVDHALVPITVTGVVRVNELAPQPVLLGDDIDMDILPEYQVLRIEAGGRLSAEDLYVGGAVTVGGTLALRRGKVFTASLTPGSGINGITIEPGGRVFLENSIVTGALTHAVVNGGELHARHSTLMMEGRFGGDYTLLTNGAGQTTLASSVVLSQDLLHIGRGFACGGTPPLSLGYNAAHDATCAFSGPGDVIVARGTWNLATYVPLAGTAMVDAIPTGTNGCGTEVTVDRVGQARPTDADGVAPTGCDMGAFERAGP